MVAVVRPYGIVVRPRVGSEAGQRSRPGVDQPDVAIGSLGADERDGLLVWGNPGMAEIFGFEKRSQASARTIKPRQFGAIRALVPKSDKAVGGSRPSRPISHRIGDQFCVGEKF